MEHKEIITEKLGFEGRMIAGSKSGYRRAYPNRNPIFNANIITSQKKVWNGDLAPCEDRAILQDIANTLKENIYILREMDARFGSENDSLDVLISRATVTIKPK